MCTLTWRHEGEGYDLFFNRDERKTRQPEYPPSVLCEHGMTFIAPRDGDQGGTWLAVNVQGVTHAVLNHYDREMQDMPPEDPLSRGLLPFYVGSGMGVVEDLELPRFRPFYLVRVAPGKAVQRWVWDGRTLANDRMTDAQRPVTTSSYDSGRAIRIRGDAFRNLTSPNANDLASFHRSSSPHGPAYGVLMKRDDAQTMSITHIQVAANEVVVNYEPQRRDAGTVLERTVTCLDRVASH